MSKQRPTADRITNELSGASAFFKSRGTAPEEAKPEPVATTPMVTPQPKPQPITPVAPVTPPVEVTRTLRTPRTPVRPARRQMIRHPFELYMDHLDTLRDLAESQRRRGEPASMSRMVREVIDRYLDEHPLEV